jgi:hypothetical protein
MGTQKNLLAIATPEREGKQRLIADLFLGHALRDQQDVVDGRADGLLVARDDESRHRLSRCDALVSETDHCVAVVSDKNAVLSRGPGQDRWVSGLRRQRILDAYQINVWQAAT